MAALRRFVIVSAACWLGIVLLDLLFVHVLPEISLKIYFYLSANKDFHRRISAYLLLRVFLMALLLMAVVTPAVLAFGAARDVAGRADPAKGLAYGAGAAMAAAAVSFLLIRAVSLTPMLLRY